MSSTHVSKFAMVSYRYLQTRLEEDKYVPGMTEFRGASDILSGSFLLGMESVNAASKYLFGVRAYSLDKIFFVFPKSNIAMGITLIYDGIINAAPIPCAFALYKCWATRI